MVEELDERPASGDVSSQRPEGFRQRAHLNIHPPVHAEVIDRAASVLSEHPARMSIVDHHDAVEFLGQRAQAGKSA